MPSCPCVRMLYGSRDAQHTQPRCALRPLQPLQCRSALQIRNDSLCCCTSTIPARMWACYNCCALAAGRQRFLDTGRDVISRGSSTFSRLPRPTPAPGLRCAPPWPSGGGAMRAPPGQTRSARSGRGPLKAHWEFSKLRARLKLRTVEPLFWGGRDERVDHVAEPGALHIAPSSLSPVWTCCKTTWRRYHQGKGN